MDTTEEVRVAARWLTHYMFHRNPDDIISNHAVGYKQPRWRGQIDLAKHLISTLKEVENGHHQRNETS